MRKKVSFLLSGILSAMLVFAVGGSISKAAVYEQESNDDFASANQIAVNTEIIGSLGDSAKKDYYKFSLDNDGVININFKNNKVLESVKRWYINLYDANAESLTSFTAYEEKTGADSSSIGLPKGTYYLYISSEVRGSTSYYSNADYNIKVSYSKSDYWETEFNGDFKKADTIPVNTEIHGSLGDSERKDYYKFSLDNDGVIKIDFINNKVLESVKRWYIYLYDADGKSITSYTANEKNEGTSSPNIGLRKGSYYLSVSSEVRGSTSYYSYVDYRINVSYTQSDTWEKEGNNSFKTADEIQVNTDITGSLGNGTSDFYKFTTDSDGYINVVFTNTEVVKSSNIWYIGIYNSNGDQMESYQTSEATSGLITWNLGIPKGEYYIKISGKESYTSKADYTFKVSFTQADNWEKEFDNDYNSAVSMGTESVINGTSLNKDKDYFKLSIPEPGYYRLGFNHTKVPGSSTGWDISFQDEHGKEMYSYAVKEVDDEQGVFNIGVLAAKEYYVVISGDCGYSYSFSINRYIRPTSVTSVVNKKDGISVTWANAAEYTSYDLYRQVGVQGQWVLLKSGLTGTSYFDNSAKTEGTRYGYAVVVNKDNFKSEFGFIINRYRLNQPAVKKVKKKKKAVVVSWAKHKNADGYIIEYSRNKKFKKNVMRIYVSGSNKSSRKISKLKSKKTYYIRFCSYKGGTSNTSVWSKTVKVKVK